MTDYIFDQVQRYRDRFRTTDPYALLDGMGVVVKRSNAFRSDGLRGYCTIMNRSRYVVINGKQSEAEQRVVASHEAGHLILHKAQLKVGALQDFDFYNTTSRLERQANLFAADFLIDDEAVLDLVRTQDVDFFDVARQLCVPAPFLSFKLFSMVNRGFAMRLPADLNSTFLKSN